MAILIRPEDVPKDLICPICLLLPTDPWILHECSHVFCGGCIRESLRFQRSKRQRTSCPVCRVPCSRRRDLFPLREANPLAHRIWSGIAVKCDGRDCRWTGALSDYESHKRSSCCPQKGTKGFCHPREMLDTSQAIISDLKEELDKKIEENKKIVGDKDKLEAYTKTTLKKFQHKYNVALEECKAMVKQNCGLKRRMNDLKRENEDLSHFLWVSK